MSSRYRFVKYMIVSLMAFIIILLALISSGGWVDPAAANGITVIYVTTTDDDDPAGSPDGDCALREAILSAITNTSWDACEAGTGTDMISIPAGTINLNPALGTISLSTDMEVAGAGQGLTVIDGLGATSIFSRSGAIATIEIHDMTIQNGQGVSGSFGGCFSQGSGATTIFYNVAIMGCTSDARGGAIYINGGDVTITDSLVSNNEASFGASGYNSGGAIYMSGGSLTLLRATFSNNRVEQASPPPPTFDGRGGAIHKGSTGGQLIIQDSTFENNQAKTGGAIMSFGDVRISGSTFTGNSASSYGDDIHIPGSGTMVTIVNSTLGGEGVGSIRNDGGTVRIQNSTFYSGTGKINLTTTSGTFTIKNSILVSNGAGNCSGPVISEGYNIENLYGCGFSGLGDISGVDAGLSSLGDYGGPTWTRPIFGGYAVNAGNPAGCTWDDDNNGGTPEVALTTDQRGETRPHGAACDMGAYEYQLRVPVDFDADHGSEVVVFRTGAWRFFDYDSASFDHGMWTGSYPGCIPIAMDYDGDDMDEPTLFCGGAWHFYDDNGFYIKGIWTGGLPGDLPVPASFTMENRDDIVVWRAGAWRFFDFASGTFDHGVWTGSPPNWVGGTNIPVPMDYDGDGFANFTVFSGGPWHFYNDDGSYNKGIWTGGVAGDLPVPADYDGDIAEEVVIWRAGAWRFFDFDTAAFDHGVWTGSPPHWTGGTSLPAPLDYDGDGIVEFTVFSGGPWHFYNDAGGYVKGIWTGGVVNDTPISRRLLP